MKGIRNASKINMVFRIGICNDLFSEYIDNGTGDFYRFGED